MESIMEEAGTGYLTVHVTTAGGAIPLEGALVTIRSYAPEEDSDAATRGDAVAVLTSGRDGNTARIPLTAPPRANSAAPNSGPPYALYQAEVVLDGYYDQRYVSIPIFDGITAIQPAVLIPLPENGAPALPRRDGIRYYEGFEGTL